MQLSLSSKKNTDGATGFGSKRAHQELLCSTYKQQGNGKELVEEFTQVSLSLLSLSLTLFSVSPSLLTYHSFFLSPKY